MNKKGFTLAEVLMVLAIIGVVAALTIPAVLSSTRGKEYQAAAAKALATLTSAVHFRYALEEESMEDYSANSIGAYLTQEIDTVTKKRAMVGVRVQGTPNSECGNGTTATCKVEAQDGAIWLFPSGAASGTGTNQCSNLTDGCVIWVDTNGVRGPTRNNISASGITCSGANNFSATTSTSSRTALGNLGTTTNACPDLIALRIVNRNVEAADQRTRNILVSGHANISQ